jgi:nitroreductase
MVHHMNSIEAEGRAQAFEAGQPRQGLVQVTQEELIRAQTIDVTQRMQVFETMKQKQNAGWLSQEQMARTLAAEISPKEQVPEAIKQKAQVLEVVKPKDPVFEAIKQRRSVGQVTQEEPTREQIERLLEAATYAPSHHVTEPWHFFVVTGAAREGLGHVMATSLSMRMENRTSEKARMQLLRERNKPLRAPVIITVAMMGLKNMPGLMVENIEAAGAAVQNMLLVAQEMGLATLWRTGDTAYDPFVKSWFGMDPEDHIVGFVYVGFPKAARPMRTPTPFAAKTIWLS